MITTDPESAIMTCAAMAHQAAQSFKAGIFPFTDREAGHRASRHERQAPHITAGLWSFPTIG